MCNRRHSNSSLCLAVGFCEQAVWPLLRHWFHFPVSQATRMTGLSVIGPCSSLASRCSAHAALAASSAIDADARKRINRIGHPLLSPRLKRCSPSIDSNQGAA